MKLGRKTWRRLRAGDFYLLGFKGTVRNLSEHLGKALDF
ncbi:hypothetical protein GPLA_0195 [Paraglaciecola polaris LMG 21857]|uniref:Uncharacterized protein n=1 Tax=Paraglaciecola polaris LMG 21857 TaxID=1129793 RepID=K6YED9_9ALTE|nr:hypothetical protein GPLA_0195 [Paraglaciecola polaris LMG 21857]